MVLYSLVGWDGWDIEGWRENSLLRGIYLQQEGASTKQPKRHLEKLTSNLIILSSTFDLSSPQFDKFIQWNLSGCCRTQSKALGSTLLKCWILSISLWDHMVCSTINICFFQPGKSIPNGGFNGLHGFPWWCHINGCFFWPAQIWSQPQHHPPFFPTLNPCPQLL